MNSTPTDIEELEEQPEWALRIIKTNGEVRELNRPINLTELQAAVGGYIEMVPCADSSIYLYINEEGTLDNLPRNDVATMMVRADVLMYNGIRGDVVVMRS